MKYQEIMDSFDQLFLEVAQMLRGEEVVEGDPPLHDLGPRLQALCAAVLRLPMDEIGPAKERMNEFKDTLVQVSALMDEAIKANNAQKASEDIDAETIPIDQKNH